MAKSEPQPPAPKGEQSIEELQRRYQALTTKKTQAETLRDAAKEQLEALKAQARTKYGTDDVTELKRKLDDMVAENNRKRADYQADLDKIERDLAEVERTFAEAARESGSEGTPRP